MKARKILTIILGIVMVLTGIYCVFTPADTYMTLGWVIGFSMLLDAIGKICVWAEAKKWGMADGWVLADGILSAVFGIVLLISEATQFAVDMFILYFAAIWIMAIGIMRIVRAFRLRRIRRDYSTDLIGRRWGLILAMGILMVISGIFCILNPTVLAIAIGINIGISILIAGANLISVAAV